MSKEDWYRNTDWNDGIEKSFFDKLSRARSQRDQYLAIQASTLAGHKPETALRLIDHYFETRKSDFDDVLALCARAEAYRSQNNITKAVEAYKDVFSREGELPGHRTRTYLDLPYFVACQELSAEYEFALSVLAKGLDIVAFPVDRFLWHASQALILSAQGADAEASQHARKALEAAQVRKSGFRFHQDVGLVGKEHQTIIKKLVRLAA